MLLKFIELDMLSQVINTFTTHTYSARKYLIRSLGRKNQFYLINLTYL